MALTARLRSRGRCVRADADSAGQGEADARHHAGVPQPGALLGGERRCHAGPCIQKQPSERPLTLEVLAPPQALRKAGLGDANLVQLACWNEQLQAAFERMANVKEYRCG